MITLLFVLFWGSDPLIPSMNQSIGYDIIIAQPGTWQHLGTRKVNRRLDRDIIPVTIRDGLFTKIKIEVLDGSINMRQCIIEFGDGTKQIVEIRKTINANESTRNIDITGNRRVIKQVEFIYDTKGIKLKKAKVKLYGFH